MTSEELDKILAKIPTDKIYEDLLQPGLKRVGEALSNVFDFGNLIMLPFKLINERSRIYLRHNLELYERKLSQIKNEDLCKVQEQIGLPIIEKLTVINQTELSEIFINLLTKASSAKTLYLVHPAFLGILNNLSADEAIILFANRNYQNIPFIDIYINKKTYKKDKPSFYHEEGPKSSSQLKEILDYSTNIDEVSVKTAFNLTGLEKTMKLYFPQNIDVYIENLERSGIISFERDIYYGADIEKYNELKDVHYKDVIADVEKVINISKSQTIDLEINIRYCYIRFTDFGKAFINAVINDIEEKTEQ
jgi:hypothetical protein